MGSRLRQLQEGGGARTGLFRGVDNREGAKGEAEGKEKGRGRREPRKEADEGTGQGKDTHRRGRDRGEKTGRVLAWVCMRVVRGMAGAGRLCGSQHNCQRTSEGQFSLLLWLSGEGPRLRETKDLICP